MYADTVPERGEEGELERITCGSKKVKVWDYDQRMTVTQRSRQRQVHLGL